MNIGIISQIRQKNITGINRVTVGLMSELLKSDQNNGYFFLGRTDWLPIDIGHFGLLYDSSRALELDFLLHSHHFDVVHSHYRPFHVGKMCSVGKILTIHDLIPLLHPEWNNNQYDYFDGPIRKCAESVDVIISDSEHTKKDIVKAYGIQPEKIKVVYCGLYNERQFSGWDMGKAVESLQDHEFLLSVSAVGANKNQQGMMRAFLQFKAHHPTSDLKLVICGPVRQYDVIRQMEREYDKLADDIIFTGFVSDEELSWLYHKAIAFIYVSFYEGFGLPILEALASGRAVICSETSSMPEVGGDAAEYCNPYDTDSIECAIANVVTNETRRKELESKSVTQAFKFSYEKAAKETLEIYRMFE